ncbi:MAG: energy transducer TonB [Candidatus Tectomicrobia bacterium]|uniref:Energy transducer TonB n=1 Tax=Tectimicrobiota bacterium TaxID=2528274 RepID=A0A938B315_UNCTE|nr:energy transducer TonB [Candidatus Tectomicrobia bacterium]
MNQSRLPRALLLSLLVHLLGLGVLRFLSLSEHTPSPSPPTEAPIAVRLFEAAPAPSLPPAQTARIPERIRPLPEAPAPARKPQPEAPKPPPAPRQAEPTPPKVTTPPPQRGGTVVDLPKPVREERPDDARLISRYDSKAQDIGPGEGGTRKPSGEQPRAMPPEIPLPERYSTGKPNPPEAALEATPAPASPAPPATAPAPPRTTVTPPAGAGVASPRPPAPQLKSEVVPTPKPPVPIPQTKPVPAPRPVPPAAPKAPVEEKRRPEAPSSPPPAQAKAAPRLPEAPRALAEAPRQEESTPPASTPSARPTPPAAPSALPESRRRAETPAPPSASAPPSTRPLTPEEQRRFRLTVQQELAMVQRDSQAREGAGRPSGGTKQGLDEHFARLEKRLPSFDAPGVFERGPERAGEGRGDGEGGKYRSISSFGFKHTSYLLGMQRKIELVFSVPPLTPDHGAIGVPIVGFTVRRDGQLAETVLLRSSGYPAVDQALLRAVKRAAPYHPFPADMPDSEISIRIYASLS